MRMIYIVGGASRSGKTLLSRRVVSEKKIPYFPLDAVCSGLSKGVKEFEEFYSQPFIVRAEKLWPVVKPIINSFLDEEDNFLLEGDSILPKQVSEFNSNSGSVKACFFGYPQLTKEEKLKLVRTYHQGDKDWTKDISDQKMLTIIDEMIEFSNYLKKECAKYDIAYFDISHDFEGPREEAFNYLFSQ